MTRPQTAALLSFLLPGLGQAYNRKYLRALFWLIITPGLWLGTGGLLGWAAHIVSAATAHSYAKKLPAY